MKVSTFCDTLAWIFFSPVTSDFFFWDYISPVTSDASQMSIMSAEEKPNDKSRFNSIHEIPPSSVSTFTVSEVTA